jgi:hypothetical protein
MKLFINHLSTDNFEKYLNDIKHINFSLFIDSALTSYDDLSNINILVLQEPNEYFNLHNWAIANHELFSVILTWG